MKHKREVAAAERAKKDRATRDKAADEAVRVHEPDYDHDDVYKALRTLGYRDGESRRAIELCADMPDAPAEDKLRRALTYFRKRCYRVERLAKAAVDGPAAPLT
jgi:Holliday junction resolvasome RuvABC DNA-binding subunit